MSMSLSFQNFLTTATHLPPRRLLLYPSTAAAGSSPEPPRPGFGSFDMNVVMVLSVLLCALVCSLGLNAILKCALRCSTLLASLSAAQSGGLVVHSKGVRRNALKKFPTVEYSKEANKLLGAGMLLDGECVICLAEFEAGERLRVLPKCYHGFHVHCIDKWLTSHASCPKCRNSLSDAARKIIIADPPSPPLAADHSLIIAPLERENLICNYRESR